MWYYWQKNSSILRGLKKFLGYGARCCSSFVDRLSGQYRRLIQMSRFHPVRLRRVKFINDIHYTLNRLLTLYIHYKGSSYFFHIISNKPEITRACTLFFWRCIRATDGLTAERLAPSELIFGYLVKAIKVVKGGAYERSMAVCVTYCLLNVHKLKKNSL